jgi:hypothetical protein
MAAFNEERAQYTNRDSPLFQFLPRLQGIVDHSDEEFMIKDAFGRILPPCIVMERGESLNLWVQRNKREMDLFTCMQVQILHHVQLSH